LHDLRMENVAGTAEPYLTDRMDALTQWRSSTVEVRRVGHPLLSALMDVENALLVLHRRIPPEAESIARAQGWEVDALIEYVSNKERDFGHLPSVTSSASFGMDKHHIHDLHQEPRYLRLPVAITVVATVILLLLLGLILINDQTATSVTNRTMVYVMLLAPSGALLRWKLSAWNGNATFLPPDWQWLPAGTFFANVFGSAVSISAVAIEYRLNTGYSNMDITNFWVVGTIRAIKVGFAGSLTTVSTFVAEVAGFMHGQTDHAYPYILVTLCSSSFVACLVYALIVFAL
jgi:fluoride ion exporter CrcB/FEX